MTNAAFFLMLRNRLRCIEERLEQREFVAIPRAADTALNTLASVTGFLLECDLTPDAPPFPEATPPEPLSA